MASTTLASMRVWFDLSVAAIFTTPVTWLLFAARYTGRDSWQTRRRVAGLFVIPAAIAAATVTNYADLVYVDPGVTAVEAFAFAWGPGAWAFLAYAYALSGVGFWLLFTKTLRSRNVYRQRTAFLLLIGLTILISHTVGMVGLGPFPHLSLVPLSFIVVGVLSVLVLNDHRILKLLPIDRAISFFGSRFDELAPIARDIVIEEMESGVVILDANNRIVDLNPIARRIFDGQDARIVGKDIQDVVDTDVVVDEDMAFLDPDVTEGHFTEIWAESTDGERRCYDVVLTDLAQERDDISGRVAIIHDVTEKQHRKQQLKQQAAELERQNAHLEEFASAVSHDLRSPLSVAEGNVIRTLETGELTHLEKTREAHERMGAIIDDVLTLARQGQTVDERDTVSLVDLASRAWNTVETDDATIEFDVHEEVTLEADATRLQQVFENLFRNAVEHGSTSPRSSSTHEDAVEHGSTSLDSQARQDAVEHGSTSPDSQAPEDAVEHGSTNRHSPSTRDDTVETDLPDADSRPSGRDEEHDSLTLRIGRLETGFFVEDDGCGIPPGEHQRVTEEGYTTSDDGTGFGLSIVKTIAEAHGWELRVTESEVGGARFEITDVWDDR